MATGDPHNFGYGMCWCGLDHAQDAYNDAFERGRQAGMKHEHDTWECSECHQIATDAWRNGSGWTASNLPPEKHVHSKACPECRDFYFNN